MEQLRRARHPLRRRRPVGRRTDRGLVMVVVLVVLVVLLMGGLGVVRSADTANVLAGNFSFQRSAAQAADRALTDALSILANRVTGGAGNNAVTGQYLPTADAAVDSRGVPTAIDWTTVGCTDEKGVSVSDCAVDAGAFRVQYVIERQCASSPDLADITDIRARCAYDASDVAGSAISIGLHYRVLIRVRGPRGTESWFEAVVSGPASS